jgi:hypothetical protein
LACWHGAQIRRERGIAHRRHFALKQALRADHDVAAHGRRADYAQWLRLHADMIPNELSRASAVDRAHDF